MHKIRLFDPLVEHEIACPCCGAIVPGITRHSRGRPWSAAQDAFIARAAGRGAGGKLIARVFGTSPSIINQRLAMLRERQL